MAKVGTTQGPPVGQLPIYKRHLVGRVSQSMENPGITYFASTAYVRVHQLASVFNQILHNDGAEFFGV